MKGYIFTIIAVSVISGIISSMISGSKTNIKKYLNFVSGLICAISLLSPIVSIAKNIDSFSNSIEEMINELSNEGTVSEANKIILDAGKEQISEGIKKAIIAKYGFDESDINIAVCLNDKNIEAIILEKIEIYLKNKATWTDELIIKDYVEGLVGCQVEIIKL